MKIFIALLLLLAGLSPASAETYRVDLIVFLDKSASSEQSRAASALDTSHWLDLKNAGALKIAGIEILPDEQFGLTDAWQRLKTAKRYQPLIKLAWLQKDPPSERGSTLQLKWGETFGVSGSDGLGASLQRPVDGGVALLLGNYLSLDIDLAYTEKTGAGDARVYRLREKRRMKRDDLHHLDSPKLGVLAKVSKAAAP